MEAIQLSECTVNPGAERTGPADFELRRVLGRGGYGKVFQVSQKKQTKRKTSSTSFIQ